MKKRKIPLRMCIGCREMKPKRDMVRVVKNQSGEVNVDTTSKMPGRGAYLCDNPACLDKAVKAKMLNKALEANVEDAVIEQLKRALERHGLQ
jgi:predicted RNA-binding protein YlxR (DUF448 family)